MSSDVLHPRWGAWQQFDRLGIWNHQDRLARVSQIAWRWDLIPPVSIVSLAAVLISLILAIGAHL